MALPASQVDEGKIEISTSRLLIREARQRDAVALYEAFRDPEVMRYWYGFRPSKPRHTTYPVQEHAAAHLRRTNAKMGRQDDPES